MSYEVVVYLSELDPDPEITSFEQLSEAKDFVAKTVEKRIQWRVDHSPHRVSEQDLKDWEKLEQSYITMAEEQSMTLKKWNKKYKPLLISKKPYTFRLFELDSKVFKRTKIEHIWAWIHSSNGDVIERGICLCNVIGYIITENPWKEGCRVEVEL